MAHSRCCSRGRILSNRLSRRSGELARPVARKPAFLRMCCTNHRCDSDGRIVDTVSTHGEKNLVEPSRPGRSSRSERRVRVRGCKAPDNRAGTADLPTERIVFAAHREGECRVPPGKRPTGGGYEASGNGTSVRLLASHPTDVTASAPAWVVEMYNPGTRMGPNDDATAYVYAVCLTS